MSELKITYEWNCALHCIHITFDFKVMLYFLRCKQRAFKKLDIVAPQRLL